MRARLKILAVNLLVLLGLLLVVELALGTWFFGPNMGSLNVQANVHRTETASPYYPKGATVHFRRDRYGLRGQFGEPKDVTILAVGGSTTLDWVVNEGDTWPDVLQRELRAAGIKAGVANAGVNGHTTVGHLRAFEVWFPRVPGLRPKYVLFFVGFNDRGLPPDASVAPDRLEHQSAGRRFRTYVENNSALVRGWRVARGWFLARDIGVHYGTGTPAADGRKWVEAKPPEGWPDRDKASVEAYARRIRLLAERTRAWGATPIFVTQLNGNGRRRDGRLEAVENSDGGAIYAQMELYNRALMESCAAVRGICVDLAAEIQFQPGDFYDSIHTTPAGSARIGKFLAAKLAPLLRAN